jgi:hypothetical protein
MYVSITSASFCFFVVNCWLCFSASVLVANRQTLATHFSGATPARLHLKSTKSVPKSTNSTQARLKQEDELEPRRTEERSEGEGETTTREGTLTTILPMLRFSVDHHFLKWVPDPIAEFTLEAGVLVKDQGQSSSLDLMLVRLVGGDGDVMRGEGKSTGAEMLVVEELENL